MLSQLAAGDKFSVLPKLRSKSDGCDKKQIDFFQPMLPLLTNIYTYLIYVDAQVDEMTPTQFIVNA